MLQLIKYWRNVTSKIVKRKRFEKKKSFYDTLRVKYCQKNELDQSLYK